MIWHTGQDSRGQWRENKRTLGWQGPLALSLQLSVCLPCSLIVVCVLASLHCRPFAVGRKSHVLGFLNLLCVCVLFAQGRAGVRDTGGANLSHPYLLGAIITRYRAKAIHPESISLKAKAKPVPAHGN